MLLHLQAEYVKGASAHDLAQLGLAPIFRPSLGGDLDLLPIQQRLKCIQVSNLITSVPLATQPKAPERQCNIAPPECYMHVNSPYNFRIHAALLSAACLPA